MSELTVEGDGLQLITEAGRDGQVDSVIPLRWCISREISQLLQDQGILDPHLLIVIAHGDREMDRKLVPLTDMMCYVSFASPGNNSIRATIVASGPQGSTPRKVLFDRYDNGNFRASVLRRRRPEVDRLRAQLDQLSDEFHQLIMDGAPAARKIPLQNRMRVLQEEILAGEDSEEARLLINTFDSIWRLDEEARLDVQVPEEMFASDPPRWMRWLGEYYTIWERVARDQCQLRRRALFTAATLPIYWLLKGLYFGLVGGLVTGFNLLAVGTLLLFGMRRINYQPLRHPLTYPPKDIWRRLQDSVWTHRIEMDESVTKLVPRHGTFYVLNPPVILFAGILAWVAFMFVSLQVILIAVAIIVGIGFLLFGIGALIEEAEDAELQAKRREERSRILEENRAQREQELARELARLACEAGVRAASVEALPRPHRTVKLRAAAIKAQVCKPYAR